MKMISLDSVSCYYEREKVLDRISLDIDKGERTVILGPSGCGKTTILRLIAGFIAPDKGSISIAGVLVSRDGRIIRPPEQRHLGMVFQDLALWPHLSVKGNIEFGLKAKGVSKIQREQKIREILELTGMMDFMPRKPAQLSGGEQQRVAIARALVLQPSLLLMDEPLSSLDIELNVKLRTEVLRLQQTLAFTLLYVTHNHDEALAMASRIVVMNKGRIQYQGKLDGIKKYLKGSSNYGVLL